MSKVTPDGVANNVAFRLKPAPDEGKTVAFDSEKGTERQAKVLALRLGPAGLAAFDAAELLDAPLILLVPLAEIPVLQSGQRVPFPSAGRPVVRVAVCGDHPEHTD